MQSVEEILNIRMHECAMRHLQSIGSNMVDFIRPAAVDWIRFVEVGDRNASLSNSKIILFLFHSRYDGDDDNGSW